MLGMVDLHIKKHDMGLIISLGLISIVASMGLQCSMQLTTDLLSEEEMAYGRLRKAILCISRSLPDDRFISALLVLAIGVLMLCAYRYVRQERRLVIYAGVFSFVFAVTQLFCKAFDYADVATPITENLFTISRACIIVVGYFIPTFCLVILVFTWLTEHATKQSIGKYDAHPDLKQVCKLAGIIFLCWLPYLILFYPGVSNFDVGSEIMQYFHLRNDFILSLSVAHGDTSVYATNMHPWFDTLVFGSFIKAGLILGDSVELGVAYYSVSQMAAFSILFAYIWKWFERVFENRGGGLLRWHMAYSALCPLYAIFSVSMLKDTLFSFSCLLTTFLLIRVIATDGKVLKGWTFLAIFTGSLTLLTLTKNQGWYILVVASIPSIIIMHKYWRKLAIAFLFPVVFYLVIWSGICLPAMHVVPGGKQEGIGFMFQQTARFVQTYPDEVTASEQRVIAQLLPYDELNELYNPTNYDAVKYRYNQDATDEMLHEYYRVWWKMFQRHPAVYFEALWNCCYGYFGFNQNTPTFYTKMKNVVEKGHDLYIENKNITDYRANTIKDVMSAVHQIPVIGLLTNIAAYSWIVILIVWYAVYVRAWKYIIPSLIALISIGVYTLSPDNANIRYAMPVMYMVLPLIPMTILCVRPYNN